MDSSSIDVLIVGAGPVGYMAALTLARYGVDFRIIDKRALPVQTGHASGLHPRTQEIFHTMGIVHKLTAQAGQVRETAFWGPDASAGSELQNGLDGAAKSGIKRTSVEIEVTDPTPYPRVCVNHQGNLEATFDEELSKRGHHVQRPVEFLRYEYTEQPDYPIRVHVKDLNTGATLLWQCKYLLGCDGAASVARKVAGITSQRKDSKDHWAVADVQFQTDFPDFRRRCAIQTKHGNLMLIPSPHNTMRIYMLLSAENVEELERNTFEAPSANHSPQPRTNDTTILDILNRRIPTILHPYTLTITHVDWISRYGIAQRLSASFTDAREHVFLLGDACHTHSPKAGQGMNIGMQDAYNLTWKLALVLKGRAQPAILSTYNAERKHIAEQLIALDVKLATMFGATRDKDLNTPAFRALWAENHGFISGCAQRYPPGLLVNPTITAPIDSTAEAPLTPGRRLLPMQQLVRHIDGWLVNILDDMPCNGPRFHVFVFAGDLLDSGKISTEFSALYASIGSPTSILHRYSALPNRSAVTEWAYEDIATPPSLQTNQTNADRVVDLFIIHTSPHLDVAILPQYRAWKYRFYEDEGRQEHQRRGLRTDGAITVEFVRPDGVVGLVCGAGELQRVEEWMDGFMVKGKLGEEEGVVS